MNIYCFSTLSFAKLQFKSVINKAFHKHGVASFTDAWIETEGKVYDENWNEVASFTDAWIETMTYVVNGDIGTSHLLQMRGLKPKYVIVYHYHVWSHLLQMRGLKLFYRLKCKKNCFVASFTDAWIETSRFVLLSTSITVASFTDAWIETFLGRCSGL